MRRIGLALAVVVLVTTACGSATRNSSSAKTLHVVTTTTQLTDFARNVGGRFATVYGVLKANVDPHDYEPNAADLTQIANADVIVKNGVGLEGWFESTVRNAEPTGAVVDASRGVTLRRGTHAGEPTNDPHIWQNPLNAIRMVRTIATSFARADPSHRAAYAANTVRYVGQLRALDRLVAARLSVLTNKNVVTNHDAFGYYLDHYGLTFAGSVLPSFDTQAELSARDVRAIVAKIKQIRVKAIFSEASLPPRTANAIGHEAHVRVVSGSNALYGDTLGPEASGGATYLQMIRHNTREFVTNLR